MENTFVLRITLSLIIAFFLSWLIIYLKNHIDFRWKCINCGKVLKGEDKKDHKF